jgi:murein DD-endopeptidase MepM/ murein hydrolase activator NlpD
VRGAAVHPSPGPARRALAALVSSAVLATLAPAIDLARAEVDRPFVPGETRVAPGEALFDGRKPIELRYRFKGPEPLDLRIRVLKASNGKPVQSWVVREREPGTGYVRRWNGTNRKGRAVPGGRYRFRFAPTGSKRQWRAGSVVLRDHVYPVDGPHFSRGAIGEFGAPRSGGRTHEGYDVIADCGRPLIASRGGRVRKAGYDDALYGWFVLVDGRKTELDYFYAHLRKRPAVRRGARVHTGERIGEVGMTGNARTTPCHLHFELHGRHGPFDPKPNLRRWDRWS